MKNVAKRALRTFFQTAIGYIAMNIPDADWTSKDVLLGLGISATAAGLAAVMNYIDEVKKDD